MCHGLTIALLRFMFIPLLRFFCFDDPPVSKCSGGPENALSSLGMIRPATPHSPSADALERSVDSIYGERMESPYVLLLLLVFRSSVDALAVWVFGLSCLRKRIEWRFLAIRVVGAGIVVGLVRFGVPNIGVSSTLMMLSFIVFLATRSPYHVFGAAAAAMIGNATMALLDLGVTFVFFDTLRRFTYGRGLFHAVMISWYLPGALLVFSGAIAAWRSSQAIKLDSDFSVFATPRASIATAQLITVVLVTMAATMLVPVIPSEIRRGAYVSAMVIPLVVIIALVGATRRRSKAMHSALDLFDLVVIAAVIHVFVGLSQGSASPLKVLYVPYVVTNALKKRSRYGVASVILVGMSLLFHHRPGGIDAHAMSFEADLVLTGVLVFVVFMVRSITGHMSVIGRVREVVERTVQPASFVSADRSTAYSNESAGAAFGLAPVIRGSDGMPFFRNGGSLDDSFLRVESAADAVAECDVPIVQENREFLAPARIIRIDDMWDDTVGYLISFHEKSEQHVAHDACVRFALSNREIDVAALIARGLSNDEIADRLFISIPTVKTHVSRIFRKAGARNRAQLVSLLRNN